MAEHTKGPWRAVKNGIYAGDTCIAVVNAVGEWNLKEALLVSAERARLIAAAPDLLAALDNLVDFCEHVFVKPNECDDIIAARAAIHLAKHGTASTNGEGV